MLPCRMSDDPPPSRVLPLLVLGGLVALALLVWQLFPVVQDIIAHNDCVATGRTNCG